MYQAWKFDDGAGETYTVPINPNKMTKLKAARAITTRVTTAVDGQALFFEGRRPPQAWTFSGAILQKDHYLAMDHWVYDKGRIIITDHLNRYLHVVLSDFDAQIKRSVGKPWRHDYTVSGQLFLVEDASSLPDETYDYTRSGAPASQNLPGTGGTVLGTGVGSAPQGAQTYAFNNSARVVIQHSLTHRPVIEVVDAHFDQIFPSISYPDDTHVVLTFSVPTTGTAVLI